MGLAREGAPCTISRIALWVPIVNVYLARILQNRHQHSDIEQLREKLALLHKGRQITAIASEGTTIAEEDSVEDWLQRSKGIPLEAVIPMRAGPQKVQVFVAFRGGETRFAIHETASEEEFKTAVRPHLSLGPRVGIAVEPMGLSTWQIKAGHTYWVAETRQMKITLHDTNMKTSKLRMLSQSHAWIILHSGLKIKGSIQSLPDMIRILTPVSCPTSESMPHLKIKSFSSKIVAVTQKIQRQSGRMSVANTDSLKRA
jgi:hypothetical protein